MTVAMLLLTALMNPQAVTSYSQAEWDLLVRQARRANLLARLSKTLSDADLMRAVPGAPRQHLRAAAAIAERQTISVRWEVECIREALKASGAPVILLKGAAYVIVGLPVAEGRLFSDIDILVPQQRLSDVESALMLEGWQASHHDAYDQHFYRAWTHEIPPLRHVRRDTTIDVHHNILPRTARLKVDAQALLASVVAVDGYDNLYVLSPVDMLLHSVTHLFHEGEFANGMRDLLDIDGLLRHFGASTDFWSKLVPRAAVLGLARPLYYALRMTSEILHTPVPREVVDAARAGRPPGPVAPLVACCYRLALRPMHASVETTGVRLARLALYLRAHWLRMPLPLAVYHLGRKALMRMSSAATKSKSAGSTGNA